MAKTILLADDSATIRKIVELTFSDTEYRVESVADGAAALERFEASRPDVLLAAVTLPDPSGYELCRRVKLSGEAIPVLLLAGAFEPFDEQLADRCAADGHLVKPFESTTLVRKIETLLETPPRKLEAEPIEARPDEVAAVEVSGAAAGRVAPEPDGDSVPDGSGEGTKRSGQRLDPEDIDAIAREVVRLIGDDVVRDIAASIVPEIAERVVRERIRELESDD